MMVIDRRVCGVCDFVSVDWLDLDNQSEWTGLGGCTLFFA